MYSLNYNPVLHKHIDIFCKYRYDIILETNLRFNAQKLVLVIKISYFAVSGNKWCLL
jgi:hypothetical protein